MAYYGKAGNRRRERGAKRARLCLEPLEPRELLAVGLDLSFGHNGLVDTSFGAGLAIYGPVKVAEAPDSKIVLAGNAFLPKQGAEVIVQRLLADGAPDLSFGTAGEVMLPTVESHYWSATALAVQPDGKILLGGSALISATNPSDATYDLALERLNVDGSPDATFGGGGVITSVSHTDSFGGMALEADGKVVVVGTAAFGVEFTSNYKQGIEIVRYNPNGALDTTFGGAGETINYLVGQFSQGLAVAVQPDGKVVATGSVVPPGFPFDRPVLLRVNADGTLDGTFGVGGHIVDLPSQLDSSDWKANNVADLPNGDLVISGSLAIAWYDSKGNLLNTRTDLPGEVTTFGIVPNGDLFVGGGGAQSYFPAQGPGAFVMRYLSPGILDTAFGSGGVAAWAGPEEQFSNASVTFLQNGQAVATQTIVGANNSVLARLTELTTLHDAPDHLEWLNASNTVVFAHQYAYFTVAVRPEVAGGVMPSGAVTFTDDGTVLGSATLNSMGLAFLNTNGLALGTHSIEAQYAGDSHFVSAGPVAATFTVTPRPTAVNFTASPTAPQYGQLVTLAATVTASDPIPPTGMVTFTYGATVLGTATLDALGKAVLATGSLRFGYYHLRAAYGGDSSSQPSSASLVMTIAPAETATTLTSSAQPASVGQPITFTATIRSLVGVGYAFGTVTFLDGGIRLGTALVTGSGQARLTVTNLASGSHAITADYSGSSTFLSSDSAALTQQVLPAASLGATLAVLSASPSQAVFGQVVKLTASITAAQASGKPTGTVTFLDGAAKLGTAALDATGHATWSGRLNTGHHTLRAVYSGDSTFAACMSPPLYEIVTPAPTTTVLTGPASPAALGRLVTFVAAVSPAFSGSPIGTVTFFDGNTVLGTAPLNGASRASFTTTTLTAGTHLIRAQYSGSSLFAGGWSDPFTILIG